MSGVGIGTEKWNFFIWGMSYQFHARGIKEEGFIGGV
jgi:hypothetical protein